MAIPFNGSLRDPRVWQFFSQAGVAVVSVFDLEPGPAHDAPFGWGMDRARSVFPYWKEIEP
jgi:hypothetical protein